MAIALAYERRRVFEEQERMPSPAAAGGERALEGIVDAFPLLAEQRQHRRPLAYLDNAATTHKPACVLETQDWFYRHANANPLRGSYELGRGATRLYANARHAVAGFLHCADDEVVFTSGATASLNTVAYAWGMRNLHEGDEVVLPVSEHHSNLIPWQTVAELTGATLRYVLPDERGSIGRAAWEEAIGPRTKAVAVAHVSNVLGTVAPLAHIVRLAHAVGAVVVADCAQSVAHLPVDVRATGVDFAAFSAHKMYGPMGIGVLYGKHELLDAMAPLMRGGGMVEAVFETRADFAAVPTRLEAGTPNLAGAAGLAEAVQFLGDIGFDAIRSHEERLYGLLADGLAALPGVTVHGCPTAADARRGSAGYGERDDAPARCGALSFSVAGVSSLDVAEALARDNVAIRAGAHCAEPLVRFLGERATCRASVALYNTEEDVDRFLDSVSRAKQSVGVMIMASIH